MAQFVPGAIVIYSFTILYAVLNGQAAADVGNILDFGYQSTDAWFKSTRGIIAFCSFSIGAGMTIHGLHWAVLGYLERDGAKEQNGGVVELNSISSSFWHDKRIITQILLGPIKIVVEIFLLLFKGKGIDNISIEENVCAIEKDKMEAFNFLQDFYLHFAQFYAHTSYALVVLFCLTVISIIVSPVLHFTKLSVGLLLLLWIMSGCFFVISRIQLISLFSAENDLRSRA